VTAAKRDGGWRTLVYWLPDRGVDALPDALDREILSLLTGGAPHYGVFGGLLSPGAPCADRDVGGAAIPGVRDVRFGYRSAARADPTYVVTEQLARCFDEALGFIRSAAESRNSEAACLRGSFGSGREIGATRRRWVRTGS
jgi:hypothetical protein